MGWNEPIFGRDHEDSRRSIARILCPVALSTQISDVSSEDQAELATCDVCSAGIIGGQADVGQTGDEGHPSAPSQQNVDIYVTTPKQVEGSEELLVVGSIVQAPVISCGQHSDRDIRSIT